MLYCLTILFIHRYIDVCCAMNELPRWVKHILCGCSSGPHGPNGILGICFSTQTSMARLPSPQSGQDKIVLRWSAPLHMLRAGTKMMQIRRSLWCLACRRTALYMPRTCTMDPIQRSIEDIKRRSIVSRYSWITGALLEPVHEGFRPDTIE